MQVFYKLFKSFCEMPSIKPVDILAGIGKVFFFFGIGGVFIWLLFHMVAAFTVALLRPSGSLNLSLSSYIVISPT